MIKSKTARKIFLLVMSLGVMLSVNISAASAATLASPSATLTDATPGASTTYAISFNAATTQATLDEIDYQFATTASSGAGTKPAGTVLTGATLASITVGGSASSGWTLSANNTSGVIKLTNSGAAVNSGQAVVATISGITNSGLTDCANGTANSDTCYIRLSDYTGSSSLNDNGVTTYTVSSATTASATIDPSLTLTIAGVASGVNVLTPSVTTTGTSTATTLPFGNLTTTSAFMAQTLNVATNANSGYQVTMAMTTPMTGTHSQNSIQPFNAASVSWNAPVVWSAPTGNVPNTNTAWIGANTNDTRVGAVTGYAGWGTASNKFAPVNATTHIVDYSSTPDNGTSVTVTYELQANVSQPADTYTGTLKYNAVGTY